MSHRLDLLFIKKKILGKKFKLNLKPHYAKTLKKAKIFYNITEFLEEEEIFQLAYCCSKFKTYIKNDISLENKLLKASLLKLKESIRKQEDIESTSKQETTLKKINDTSKIDILSKKVALTMKFNKKILENHKKTEEKLNLLDKIISNDSFEKVNQDNNTLLNKNQSLTICNKNKPNVQKLIQEEFMHKKPENQINKELLVKQRKSNSIQAKKKKKIVLEGSGMNDFLVPSEEQIRKIFENSDELEKKILSLDFPKNQNFDSTIPDMIDYIDREDSKSKKKITSMKVKMEENKKRLKIIAESNLKNNEILEKTKEKIFARKYGNEISKRFKEDNCYRMSLYNELIYYEFEKEFQRVNLLKFMDYKIKKGYNDIPKDKIIESIKENTLYMIEAFHTILEKHANNIRYYMGSIRDKLRAIS